MQTLGPGDVLGLSWLVPPNRWHFTATAVEPITAVELDTVALRALAERDPALGYPLVLASSRSFSRGCRAPGRGCCDLYRSPRER